MNRSVAEVRLHSWTQSVPLTVSNLLACAIVFASLVQAQSSDLPKWVKDVGARRVPKAKRMCLVNAAGDGVANATKAIQQAIDRCAKSGGGIVTFKPGNYVTGALFLRCSL